MTETVPITHYYRVEIDCFGCGQVERLAFTDYAEAKRVAAEMTKRHHDRAVVEIVAL